MSLRVLLADADPVLLSIYRAFLMAQQIEVHTAASAAECLEELRQWQPDVLVLDADLLWGSELCILALMGKDPSVPVVPVLLLASARGIAKVAFSHGHFTILVKPVPTVLLRDGVRALADSRRTHPPGKPPFPRWSPCADRCDCCLENPY